MDFSILSDLKKTTEVIESLSTTSTRCSVTEITSLLHELGRFCYTVMPFGDTVSSDVFWGNLDEYFDKIEEVIIIADDIMIVSYKPDHSNYDQAFSTLLQTD